MMDLQLLAHWALMAEIRWLLAEIYDAFVHPSSNQNAGASMVLMENLDQFWATAQEWTQLYAKG